MNAPDIGQINPLALRRWVKDLLTTEQWLVYDLRHYHGMTWPEIADRANASESSVRGRFKRAQRNIRSEMPKALAAGKITQLPDEESGADAAA